MKGLKIWNLELSKKDLFKKMDREDRIQTYEGIRSNSSPSPSFYMMVCISTIIATYGLLANSTAVVIGAMLVAPLMSPIFGIALGLSNGDNKLLRDALVAEVLGMLVAIGLAALIGSIPLNLDYGSEILARTQPTLYDVIIALASGLAGAYAMVNKRLSPALPGVAISTALVPPLASCGLCLAAGLFDLALGAFMLFVVNLLAIEFAAALVYVVFGLVRLDRSELAGAIFARRFGLSLVVLLIFTVFMTGTLKSIVTERKLEEKLRIVMSEQVRNVAGARLSELTFEQNGETLEVMAVVMTPQEFNSQQVAGMEEVMRDKVDPEVRLVVRSLTSKDADRNGQVFISEEERSQQVRLLEENAFLNTVSRLLYQELNNYPGVRVVDVQNQQDNGSSNITAVVHTPVAIDPREVARLETSLNNNLEEPIHLVIRSLLTRDADANRYLYEEDKGEEPLEGDALEFHNLLQNALAAQLHQYEPAARVLELYYGDKGEELMVVASIRSPYTLGPDDVRVLESGLRDTVDERIMLLVRSTVGADASADYFLAGYDENLARVVQP